MSHKSKARYVIKRMQQLYGAVDLTMQKTGEHHKTPCKKGCNDCCHQIVTASIAEALIMVDAMDGCSKIAQDYLYKRCEKYANQLYSPVVTVASWFEKKIPCVFLSEGLCRTYEARPLACRTLMVMPGSDCSVYSPGGKIQAVDARSMTKAGLREAKIVSDNLGIPIGFAPLQVAMLWAETVYYKGSDVLNKQLRGTTFANDYESLMFWKRLEDVEAVQD
jgi:Fe-S-cluster containining protein